MRAFISYSHKDSAALERLHVHLSNLQREGNIDTWYDRDILAGSDMDSNIDSELEAADLFILLVSPDFIGSDYCINRELERALERHDHGNARVIPIIIQPCDWAAIPRLSQLKALPKDGKPISDWFNENTAYLDIVQELRKISENDTNTRPLKSDPAGTVSSKYRVKKDFDEIDRDEFRKLSFGEIRKYFEGAISEINDLELIKAKFEENSEKSFTSTVVNRSIRGRSAAFVTVSCPKATHRMADITYSFDEDSGGNSMNGGFNVSSDDYDQFLTLVMSMYSDEPDRLSPIEAAEYLWRNFVEQAGVTYA